MSPSHTLLMLTPRSPDRDRPPQATWTWSTPKVNGTPPCARVGHSLVPLPTPRGDVGLVLFGGQAEGQLALNDAFRLLPAGGRGDQGEQPGEE